MKNKNFIYLDNNATTHLEPKVLEEMLPYMTNLFGNPSSKHQFGVIANNAVSKARSQVAELIGAKTNEIIFTSGATEAINLAIKGVAESYINKGKHIITASTEHSAVLDTCRHLETKGYDVTYLPVQSDGLLDLEVAKAAIRPDTILVIVMHVNNETGVIQDIQSISKLAHIQGAIFMTDATQSVGKIPVNVDELGIDLLAFSGHKIYGPKGVGALYVRQRPNRIIISAILHGGGHEQGLRSGTLNVPGIVGIGKACELGQHEMIENKNRIQSIRDYFEENLLMNSRVSLNGNKKHRLFNVTNLKLEGIDANVLIGLLKDIAISNGSACTSAIFSPSHVLKAMGLTDEEAFSSIRVSFGKENTIEETKKAAEKISLWINQI